MDEQTIQQIKDCDGWTICSGCPCLDYDYDESRCIIEDNFVECISTEDEIYLLMDPCPLEEIKYKDGFVFKPKTFNAEELIKQYIKSIL